MTGFSLIRVENFTRGLLWLDGAEGPANSATGRKDTHSLLFDKQREKMLLDEKAQAIESSGGLLHLYREKEEVTDEHTSSGGEDVSDDLAGMSAFKKWAENAGKRMDQNAQQTYARTRGVPAMKGVLLCGVPGCGKSEAAKILYKQWKVPMVRMDMDRLMGGLVGDSERNLRQALAQVEALSPCILWIDELEKGFSAAASSNNGDGGTFKRMFGRLLTWMQENTKPCFIFATANDISCLPPEFFRSGRFDALFAAYMPTNDECKEIFKEQMLRAERLRREAAKEQGITDDIGPLFESGIDGCLTDGALQKIMNLFTKELAKSGKDPEKLTDIRGIKFLSGADIQKITANALLEIPEEKLGHPIDLATWIAALENVIKDPNMTTQGSSSANLDKIAACYVRLLRENFAPVSRNDQLLFQKDGYSCKIDNKTARASVTYTGKCTMRQPYDQALFSALRERIESIGSQVETYSLMRVCQ